MKKQKKNREKNKKNKIQLGKKVSNLVEANIARKNQIGEKRKILKSLEDKRQGIGHPRVYNIGASEMKRREDEVVYLKKLLAENPARKDLAKRYEDSLGVLQRSRENLAFQGIPSSIHKLRNSITRSLYRVSAAQKEIDEQKKKSGRMEKRGGPSREERQTRRGKAPGGKARKELDLAKKNKQKDKKETHMNTRNQTKKKKKNSEGKKKKRHG